MWRQPMLACGSRLDAPGRTSHQLTPGRGGPVALRCCRRSTRMLGGEAPRDRRAHDPSGVGCSGRSAVHSAAEVRAAAASCRCHGRLSLRPIAATVSFSIQAMRSPTCASWSACNRISTSRPLSVDSISTTDFSVSSSSNGSPCCTTSPTLLEPADRAGRSPSPARLSEFPMPPESLSVFSWRKRVKLDELRTACTISAVPGNSARSSSGANGIGAKGQPTRVTGASNSSNNSVPMRAAISAPTPPLRHGLVRNHNTMSLRDRGGDCCHVERQLTCANQSLQPRFRERAPARRRPPARCEPWPNRQSK